MREIHFQDGGNTFLDGDIKVLAFARQTFMVIRAKRGHAGMYPALKVGLMAKRLEGRQVGVIGGTRTDERPSPGVTRRQIIAVVVAVRAGLTKIGNRGHNQARIDLTQFCVIQTKPGHLARAVIMQQNIGLSA